VTLSNYKTYGAESCIAAASYPLELQARDRWVLWRSEPDANGRPTKVPYQPRGRRASSTNPGTWTTWKHAGREVHRFDGLGFVLGDSVAAVDLDHVRHPQTGAIVAWAARVIAALDTYTELSPSGTGFHLFFLGRKPPGRCNLRFDDGTAFECYETARFLTVTGQHVGGTPLELREIPLADLERVCAEMMARLPTRPVPIAPHSAALPITLDDRAVLERMFASRNGAQLARLYHGQHGYASQSDADMRLAGALAFWTGRDVSQIDRLFRASGLMRDKWNARRGETTYGAATIATACANCTVTVSRGRRHG
jgi:putative DNA primase/helicase